MYIVCLCYGFICNSIHSNIVTVIPVVSQKYGTTFFLTAVLSQHDYQLVAVAWCVNVLILYHLIRDLFSMLPSYRA